MPTKAELEARVKALEEELQFCHEVIAQISDEFRAADEQIKAIAATFKEG